MDDLSTAISGFLSQPGAMEQLESMAKQLGLGGPSRQKEPQESREAPEVRETAAFGGGLGDLLPEGFSPEKLGKLLQAVREGSQPDQTTALLEALRPMLQTEKREKLDRALRAVRLMHTARAVSKSIEL